MKILAIGLINVAKRLAFVFSKHKYIVRFMNREYFIKRYTWNIY